MFHFLATGGKRGSAPEKRNFAMQEAGLFVMRTGWGVEDTYLELSAVKLERGERSTHSHNDTAHLELMLEGEDILIDCGRYIYNTSVWKDWRRYFTGALAHNTLFVDDHTMGEVPKVSRVRGVRSFCHAFEEHDTYSLIDISHNGYVFTEDPVFHRRKVIYIPQEQIVAVIDHVTGTGRQTHDIRFVWNYATEQVQQIGAHQTAYTTKQNNVWHTHTAASYNEKTATKPWSSVLLCGSEDPKGGWVSYGYPVREPVGQIQECFSCTAPVTLATVIAKPSANVSIAVDGQSVVLDLGGRTMRIDLEHVEEEQ